MKDPWVGEEARELWDGVLRAQAEAARYRTGIASAAEAKTFKEIYPNGIEQARVTAERVRVLDEFDAAYFGALGKSAEEIGAARAALAQRLLKEDPAAFQEMVAVGVTALEEAKKQGSTEAAKIRTTGPSAAHLDGLKSAPMQAAPQQTSAHHAQIAAYSDFEKAANAELEKNVGGAIERALWQALPNAKAGEAYALTTRLSASVRQEIEKALQSDGQLGEQVAQVLASRKFDDTARKQVVRLINERAQQLVPSATKRILNDWTQTTLAAHRVRAEKHEAVSTRSDLPPAQQGRDISTDGSRAEAQRPQLEGAKASQRSARNDGATAPRGRIDYKRVSDEQILNL